MMRNLKGAVPVTKVLSEMNKTTGILRDLLSPQFNKIVTNDVKLAKEVEDYITQIAPDKKDIVQRYQENYPN